MPECATCGESVSMPFTCKFCEEQFCSTHRLPENHDCDGLKAYKEQSREEGRMGYDAPKQQPKRSATPSPRQTSSAGMDLGAVDDWLDTVVDALPASATNTVLGTIFAAFILTYLLFDPRVAFGALALDPTKALFQPWRLVTSIFLHAGLAHLLVNSIVLFSFGSEAERMLGKKRFLTALFGAALASSIGYTLAAFVFQGIPDLSQATIAAIPGATPMTGFTPAVGISGGLYGLVVLLAVLRPRIQVLAFFIIPLKIRTAVTLFVAMDALNLLTHAVGLRLPIVGGFASAGHLSGAIVGYYLGKKLKDRYAQRRRTINLFRGPGGFRV